MNNVEDVDIGEVIEQAFTNYAELRGIDLTRDRIGNKIDSIFKPIGIQLFRLPPDQKKYNQMKSSIAYNDVVTIEKVVDKYIELCQRYGAIPKIKEICNLTQIDYTTMNKWNKYARDHNVKGYVFRLSHKEAEQDYSYIMCEYPDNVVLRNNWSKMTEEEKELNSFRFDICKRISEAAQGFTRNALMETNTGPTVMANNDVEVGLMWDARRQLTAAAIEQNKTALGAGELPKLSDNL